MPDSCVYPLRKALPSPLGCTQKNNKITLPRGLLQLCYKTDRGVDGKRDRVLSCIVQCGGLASEQEKRLGFPIITVVFQLYVAFVTVLCHWLTENSAGCKISPVSSSFTHRGPSPMGEGIAYRRSNRNWKKSVDWAGLASQIRGQPRREFPKQHPYRR